MLHVPVQLGACPPAAVISNIVANGQQAAIGQFRPPVVPGWLIATRLENSDTADLGPVYGARTLPRNRLSGEVIYDQPGVALSQLNPALDVPAPLPYGGESIYENSVSSGGMVTTAATVARLIGRYAVWGIGGRAAGAARSGSMSGTSSYAASRGDGIDFCFILNTRNFGNADDPVGTLAKNINSEVVAKLPRIFI